MSIQGEPSIMDPQGMGQIVGAKTILTAGGRVTPLIIPGLDMLKTLNKAPGLNKLRDFNDNPVDGIPGAEGGNPIVPPE